MSKTIQEDFGSDLFSTVKMFLSVHFSFTHMMKTFHIVLV